MDDVDDGPALTLDELDLLRRTLEARLPALLPSEQSDAASTPGTREGFVALYKHGQRRILREAIAEVATMGEGAGGGEEDNDEEEGVGEG